VGWLQSYALWTLFGHICLRKGRPSGGDGLDRVPYEHRFCTKCNWYCVQDEEDVRLDCSSANVTELRIKHHHFRTLSSNPNRHRDCFDQSDTKGLALFVSAWNMVIRFQNTTLLAF